MIQFAKPLYLILLIPLGYYMVALTRRSLSDMSRFRSRLSLGLRAAILVMLVLALAGTRIVRNVSQQSVVFLVDVSDSIPKPKQDVALAYVNNALKGIKSEQKVGLIAFGGDASVELAPSNVNRIDKIYSVPSKSQTDISQALGLALALFPEQSSKKIVLLSDGNETRGKAIEQAMLAGSDRVSIDVVPITNELPHETLLDKMVSPNNVKVGEPFDLKAVAVAKEPTTAHIRLIRNGAPVDYKSVELSKGKNLLTFQQSIDKPGNYEYKAILESRLDTKIENNIGLSYTKVNGKPRVLYVEGEAGQAKYLANAIKSSDIDVEVRDRTGIPSSLAQLRAYDMVVYSDVPAWNMVPEQMSMIKSGVQDLGIGFTMIGGENSFGAGGYYDTPIEEALPLDMSIRKTKVLPSLSVVVVMDKSGSMAMPEDGRTKIELANDGAASVVKLLQPIDQVGVIVCHTEPVTVVPLQKAQNKDHMYEEISTIRAEGGGIAVFPSLEMAYKTISQANTRQKHIILLADGADCDDQEGVYPLVKKMASEHITTTCVAIGDGKDVPFLKGASALGKGGFYLTLRARDLKAIFTKDVMTVSKSLIIEEPFVPQMDTSSPELSGISASVPPLLGYVATSPKPTASVSMLSHKKDPILATWQFGLGKSAAFTSDCKARWSARWLSWPDYPKFWAQVLRSTMRKNASTDYQTTVDIESGTGKVAIDALDAKGNFLNLMKFKASVIGPDVKSHPIIVEQTGPGHYESTFDARDVGAYVVNVVQDGRKDIAPDVNVVNIPYPPEYKDLEPNTSLLKRLASETSGVYDPKASDVLTRNFRSSKAYTDLWRLLTILSLALLPLDIAVRRLTMSPEQAVEVYNRVREYLNRRHTEGSAKPTEEQSVETVGSLLQTKREQREAARAQREAIRTQSAAYTQRAQPTQQPQPKSEPPKPEAPRREEPVHAGPASNSDSDDVTSRLLEAKRAKRAGK